MFVVKVQQTVININQYKGAGTEEKAKAKRQLQTIFSDFVSEKLGRAANKAEAQMYLSAIGKEGSGDPTPDILLTDEQAKRFVTGENEEEVGVALPQLPAFKEAKERLRQTGVVGAVELKSEVGEGGDITATELRPDDFETNSIGKFIISKYGNVEGKQGRPLFTGNPPTINIGNLNREQINSVIHNLSLPYSQKLKRQFDLKMSKTLIVNLSGDEGKTKRSTFTFLDLTQGEFDYSKDTFGETRSKGPTVVVNIHKHVKQKAGKKIDILFDTLPGNVNKDFSRYFQGRVRHLELTASKGGKAVPQFIAILMDVAKGFAKGSNTPFEMILNASQRTVMESPVKISRKSVQKKGKGAPKRGAFISSAQLTAIIRAKLIKNMPRGGPPSRPIPKYRTGALVQSFEFFVNYRQNLIQFLNTPPGALYEGKLNENGWMLDKTLVEPTIRQITQQLFGRQFKVLRTQ